MRISDWSSDVCSSDLIFGNRDAIFVAIAQQQQLERRIEGPLGPAPLLEVAAEAHHNGIFETRREEIVLHERMEPHTPGIAVEIRLDESPDQPEAGMCLRWLHDRAKSFKPETVATDGAGKSY